MGATARHNGVGFKEKMLHAAHERNVPNFAHASVGTDELSGSLANGSSAGLSTLSLPPADGSKH